MPIRSYVTRTTVQTLGVYWMLVKITVPIAILGEVLSRLGAIEVVAPVFAPVMSLVGLPPELGLAWVTGMVVGLWGAVPLVFSLIPSSSLSVADVTVFSAMILFVHGLPVEQQIIRKAGPRLMATTVLRIAGGLLYAFLLHLLFARTGWLAAPVQPAWVPMAATADWASWFTGLAEAMITMLIVLAALTVTLDLMTWSGLLDLLMRALSLALALAGIRREAGHLTAVGLFLGISYGAGLLVEEARTGTVPPRQIFLSCVFMGFAHSIVEDTAIVLALGANGVGVLLGRIVFAVAATALVARVIRGVSEEAFLAHAYHRA